MAIRRQAPKLSEDDYAVYIEDLFPFDSQDIEAACALIGKQERAEGETAFPSIPTLLSVVKTFKGKRREAEQTAAQEAERERALRSIAAGDGEYVRFTSADLAEMVAELARKRVPDLNEAKPLDGGSNDHVS